MPLDPLEHLDYLVSVSGCRLSIMELGAFVFGGYLEGGDPAYLDDVARAGLELRRHAGLPLAVPVPPDVGCFLVGWAAEWLAERRVEAGEAGIDQAWHRLQEIERNYRGAGDLLPWSTMDDAPPDWREANRDWARIADGLMRDTLNRLAHDMAMLITQDPDEFDRRHDDGRLQFAHLVGRHDVLDANADGQAGLGGDR
jgi:hypothetical protein